MQRCKPPPIRTVFFSACACRLSLPGCPLSLQKQQWQGEGLSTESQRTIGCVDFLLELLCPAATDLSVAAAKAPPGVVTAMTRGPRSSMMQSQDQEQPEHRRCRTKTCSRSPVLLTCLMMLAAVAGVPQVDGQQMDPAAMQRQIQQQMGGSPGGGGAPPPNRIGEKKDVGPTYFS